MAVAPSICTISTCATRLDARRRVVGAGGPHLALELDPAVVPVDRLEHQPALDRPGRRCRCGSRAGCAGGAARSAGRRRASRPTRPARRAPGAGRRRSTMAVTAAAQRAGGQHREDQVQGGHLDDAEHDRETDPRDPVVVPEPVHVAILLSGRPVTLPNAPFPGTPPVRPPRPARAVDHVWQVSRYLARHRASQRTRTPAIRGRTRRVRRRGRSSGRRCGRARGPGRTSRPAQSAVRVCRSGRPRRPGRPAAAARG